jgi:hypothetical protein
MDQAVSDLLNNIADTGIISLIFEQHVTGGLGV